MNSHDNDPFIHTFQALHPLFSLSTTQVLWHGHVKKVNTHGSLQKRIFVVTNIGLFLLEQRTFPRTLIVSRFISYPDIKTIKLDQTQAYFIGDVSKMILRSPLYINFTNIVYTVQTRLFGNDINVEIDKDLSDKFSMMDFVYQTKSMFLDRFMAGVADITQMSKLNNLDAIYEITDSLSKIHASITLNCDVVSSNYMKPLVNAVSLDSRIIHLILRNVNICTFFNDLSHILQKNKVITKITFDNVSFVEDKNTFGEALKGGFGKFIQEIVFINCDLLNDEFIEFINAMKDQAFEIYSISFIKCILSAKSLETIFQVITGSNTFSGLKIFRFEHIQYGNLKLEDHLDKFIQSPLSKTIKKVFLIDLGINLSTFLPKLMQIEPIITKLNLSQNDFTAPLNTQISSFYELESLILTGCKFTPETFSSLLSSLSLAQFSPARIVFDNIIAGTKDLMPYYECLSNKRLSNVSYFSWQKNEMRPEEVSKLCCFLTNNPNIIELDISYSIAVEKLDESIQYLHDYILQSSLETLCIRGGGQTVYGKHLYPILEALGNIKTIKSLDVTGQKILERGFDYLYGIVISGLEEIYFDDSGLTSADALLQLCQDIMESNVCSSRWPELDERNIIQSTPINLRNDVKKSISKVKSEFCKKFQTPDKELEIHSPRARSLSQITSAPQGRRGSSYKNRFLRKSSSALFRTMVEEKKLQCEAEISLREDYIQKLMNECLGIDFANNLENDMVLQKYYEFIN